MIFNITLPAGVRLKMLQRDSGNLLWKQRGDIHYIGGCEVLPPPLEASEENRRINQLGTQEEARAKAILIEHNLRLVVYIAKRFDNTGVGVEDLISIGTIGLIKGIDSFSEDKGFKLSTYCSRCVENEILMHFRALKKTTGDVYMEQPIETDKDGNQLTLMDTLADNELVADRIELTLRTEKLYECIGKCLDKREYEIIVRRYGLFGKKPLTQRETADKLGISRSYVSRIEKKALFKLKNAFGE